MKPERRSFVLNNDPGGAEREPVLALLMAAVVMSILGSLVAVMIFFGAWRAWTEGDSYWIWSLGEGILMVGALAWISYECVSELRRRWKRR